MLAASAAARCMLVDISAGDGALLFDRCRALDRLPDGFERRYNISRDAVERSDFFGDLVGGLLRLIGFLTSDATTANPDRLRPRARTTRSWR